MHDPGHLLFRRALRVAIVLPLAYLFTQYVLQMPAGSTYTVFGTFVLLSFADFGGPTRDRALAYIFTGIAGLVAVVLGTVAALNPFAAVICTFIVGAGLTYTGLLRGYVATATMSILLPFVIAVTAGPGLDQLPQRLIGFAVAVVVSLAAALLMWPAHYRSALRQRIADTMDASANAVIVRGTRAGVEKHACCMTLAHRRIDVNNVVRRRLDARKASFAPIDYAVQATGMEYGGINPVGLPADWPIWVDGAVAERDWVCIGSGVRHSKLFVPVSGLLGLPGAERVDDLARDVA